MVGLQEAQVESMRRLTAGLTDAIGEAQLTLQVRSLLPFPLAPFHAAGAPGGSCQSMHHYQ